MIAGIVLFCVSLVVQYVSSANVTATPTITSTNGTTSQPPQEGIDTWLNWIKEYEHTMALALASMSTLAICSLIANCYLLRQKKKY